MDGPHPGIERRKFRREKVSFIVNYAIRKPIEVSITLGKRECDALMLDLSEGGMAVASSLDIPLSTTLDITFFLVSKKISKRMAIQGETVNRFVLKKNEYRLGIQFTKISQEDKTVISDFVKSAKFS